MAIVVRESAVHDARVAGTDALAELFRRRLGAHVHEQETGQTRRAHLDEGVEQDALIERRVETADHELGRLPLALLEGPGEKARELSQRHVGRHHVP